MDDKPTALDAFFAVQELWWAEMQRPSSHTRNIRIDALHDAMAAITDLNTGKRKAADECNRQRPE